MTATREPGKTAAQHTRADGTPAPSPDHVKPPHPFASVPHKPAIGAPGTTATKFMSLTQLAMLVEPEIQD